MRLFHLLILALFKDVQFFQNKEFEVVFGKVNYTTAGMKLNIKIPITQRIIIKN